MKNKKKSLKGFTLMEMLVTVLILIVLLAIAYPLYTKSIQKSRAVEAVNLLEMVRNKQVQQYAREGRFSKSLSSLGQLTLGGESSITSEDGTDALKVNDYEVAINDEGDCATATYKKGNTQFSFSVSYNSPGIGCSDGGSGICSSFGDMVIGEASSVCGCKVQECGEGYMWVGASCSCVKVTCNSATRPADQEDGECGPRTREVTCDAETKTWVTGEWGDFPECGKCRGTECPRGFVLNEETCNCECTKTEADCFNYQYLDTKECRCRCAGVDGCGCPEGLPIWTGKDCLPCGGDGSDYVPNADSTACGCYDGVRTTPYNAGGYKEKCICPTGHMFIDGQCLHCISDLGYDSIGSFDASRSGWTCKCNANRPVYDSNMRKCVPECGGELVLAENGSGCVCMDPQLIPYNNFNCVCPKGTIWVAAQSKCVPCTELGYEGGAANTYLNDNKCWCGKDREYRDGRCVLECPDGKVPNADGTACICDPNSEFNYENSNGTCGCDPTKQLVNGQCRCKGDKELVGGECLCENGTVNYGSYGCVCRADQAWDGTHCVPCSSLGYDEGYGGNNSGLTVIFCGCGPNKIYDSELKRCVCRSGFIDNGSGACVCPPGKTQSGYSCYCSTGTIEQGGECITCQEAGYDQATGLGSCGCYGGKRWDASGKDCVCTDPNSSEGSDGSCDCPSGMIKYGNTCVCPAGETYRDGGCVSCLELGYTGGGSNNNTGTNRCTCPTGYSYNTQRQKCVINCTGDLKPDAEGTSCVCPAALGESDPRSYQYQTWCLCPTGLVYDSGSNSCVTCESKGYDTVDGAAPDVSAKGWTCKCGENRTYIGGKCKMSCPGDLQASGEENGATCGCYNGPKKRQVGSLCFCPEGQAYDGSTDSCIACTALGYDTYAGDNTAARGAFCKCTGIRAYKNGKCEAGCSGDQVPNADQTACVCEGERTHVSGNSCICPAGSVWENNRCVSCTSKGYDTYVSGSANASTKSWTCTCTPGNQYRSYDSASGKCVTKCPGGATPNADGTCGCTAPDTEFYNGNCVCKNNHQLDPSSGRCRSCGALGYDGYDSSSRMCVCQSNAQYNASKGECECTGDLVKRGNSCVCPKDGRSNQQGNKCYCPAGQVYVAGVGCMGCGQGATASLKEGSSTEYECVCTGNGQFPYYDYNRAMCYCPESGRYINGDKYGA